MAKLIRPGPPAIRTPEFLYGLPSNTPDQQRMVEDSQLLHDRCRHLLTAVAVRGGFILLENPPTSMTFLEHSMVEWIRAIAPHAVQVHACAHGKDWEKRWMFVSNKRACFTLAADCPHDKGSHSRVGGIRNPDGSWKSRETATYPESLACAIAELIFPWVTPEPLVLPLKSWQTALPVKLSWPSIHHRIEDGGGLNSAALWLQPSVHDPLGTLRKRWLQRLCDSKLVVQISAALETGETSDMVSPTQLAPFLDDILSIFQVDSSILDIVPEQPFRLKLWQLLASSFGDLEAPFFDLLAEGVPLGVDTPLQPSPYWPHSVLRF